jgi:hypothetical protein
MDDLVKRLNMVDATMNPMTLVIVAREAADRIEQVEAQSSYFQQQYFRKCEHEFEVRKHDSQLKKAIIDWSEAIVDYEGIDFADRIEDETSRKLIESILDERWGKRDGN